jgi:hypothetical protein
MGFDGYDREVFYSVWDGETWSLPAQVSSDGFIDDLYPDVAVGPDGVAWVVWTKAIDGGTRLYYSRWNGTGWDQEELVFPELEDEPSPGSPVIEVDSEGTPWLIWSWWPGDQGSTELFYSQWLTGAWVEAEPFVDDPGPGDVGGRDLATGENGEVWVMWVRTLGSPAWESVSLYTHWEEDGWAPVDTFPRAELATQLDVGPNGEVWVAWSHEGDVYACYHTGGEWSEEERITAPDSTYGGQNASDADARISVAPSGSPWVAWVGREWGYGDFDQEIYASVYVSDQWQPESQVSITDGFHDDRADIIVDAVGRAWAVWRGFDGRDYEVLSSHSTCAGTIDQPGFQATRYSICWRPNPILAGGPVRLRVTENPDGPVTVHDLLGRLVARIETDVARTGDGSNQPLTILWDGRDVSGRLLTPGTYVSSLLAGGMRYETRIVVIR